MNLISPEECPQVAERYTVCKYKNELNSTNHLEDCFKTLIAKTRHNKLWIECRIAKLKNKMETAKHDQY
jgi:hypothetical protein